MAETLKEWLQVLRHAEQLNEVSPAFSDWLEEHGDARAAKLRDLSWMKLAISRPADGFPGEQRMMRDWILDGKVSIKVEDKDSLSNLLHRAMIAAVLGLFPEVCICEKPVRVEISYRFMDSDRSHRMRNVFAFLEGNGFDRKRKFSTLTDNDNRRLLVTQHDDEMCPSCVHDQQGATGEWIANDTPMC